MTPQPKLDRWGRPHWSFRLGPSLLPDNCVPVPRCAVCGRREYACCLGTRRDARGVCGFCRSDERAARNE